VEIPVLYDPEVAPDLQALAEEKGLTVEALVALHTAPDYRCYLLGFRPGFPFLGGLDPRLVAARLPSPRPRVPAGSIGIGGRQTGVYPVDSPGGWRLIGRTPLPLFDPARADPFLVYAGDTVRFVAIDRAAFEGMGAAR
jgi:inhibitor of KinA